MSPDDRVVYRISGTVDDVVLNWCGTREEEIALYAEAFHLAGRTLADQFGTTGAITDLEAVWSSPDFVHTWLSMDRGKTSAERRPLLGACRTTGRTLRPLRRFAAGD